MKKTHKTILLLIFTAMAAAFMLPASADNSNEPENSVNSGDFGVKMDGFIGTNGFFTDVMDNLTPFGFIREYHNWDWTEYSVGNPKNNPDASTKKDGSVAVFYSNLWNGVFDGYYKNIKNAGIDLVTCIQKGVPDSKHENPNWQDDGDPLNPKSYLAHSQSMFQHAARYGSNKNLDPDLVRVEPGGNKQIGLGYIKYYEDWNEPDATWLPVGNGQFTGAMYAAMLSADYDGHMNTMGKDAGVKNADPNAKVVLSGLSSAPFLDAKNKNNMKFFTEMINWFDENRSEEKWLEANGNLDGYVKYPFDVINVHNYCSNGKTGISPEDNKLYENAKSYVDYCRENFPGVEVWLSEFGWDTGVTHKSQFAATVEYTDGRGLTRNQGVNTGVDIYDVQGRWIIREYLILAAAGIDRAMQYMLNNSGNTDANDDGTQFSTCGFIDGGVSSNSVARKASWYYVSAMQYWLKNTRFKAVISFGGDVNTPAIYQFENEGENNKNVYAVWLTTSLGNPAAVENFKLQIGNAGTAVMVELADKEKQGVKTELEISNGTVSFKVTEKPVFIITSGTVQAQTSEQTDESKENKTENITEPHDKSNSIILTALFSAIGIAVLGGIIIGAAMIFKKKAKR